MEILILTGILRYKLGFGNSNLQAYKVESDIVLAPFVYADSDNSKVLDIMKYRWIEFEKGFPWHLKSETGKPLVTVYQF